MSMNRELAGKMVDCYRRMDVDALASLLHPESRHTAPGSDFGADLVGREKILGYFKAQVMPSFHKVDFEVVFTWEDRDKPVVIVEWRSHLWPKTGKEYRNTGAWVIEIKDGMVYWVREYFDTEKSHQNVT